MNEFLQSVLQMAETGDWNGILMLIVASVSTLLAGIGGITGIITIGRILYNLATSDKLLDKVKTVVANSTTPLQQELKEVKQELSIATKATLENLKTEFLKELESMQGNYDALLVNQQAFNATVLNNEELKLEYENYQKQFLLAKEKGEKIIDSAKIELANVKTNVETTINSVEQGIANVSSDIKQVVNEAKTAVKKAKTKLKKKVNNVAEVEYV